MSRTSRKKSATDVYHIVIRGADHQLIFEEDADYRKYLKTLQYYKDELSFEIYAYCLMNNHVHLLIYSPITPLEAIFRRINTVYSMWFNAKYNRVGFLQQGRYFSEPVEDMNYLINVIRYIHQNPFKAGLENKPGDAYPWSSIHDYKKGISTLVNTCYIMEMLGGKERFLALQNTNVTQECMDLHTLRKRIPDDVAKETIKEVSNCTNQKEFQSLPPEMRAKYLKSLKQKGLSIRQLNRLTGVSKGVIERVLRQQ